MKHVLTNVQIVMKNGNAKLMQNSAMHHQIHAYKMFVENINFYIFVNKLLNIYNFLMKKVIQENIGIQQIIIALFVLILTVLYALQISVHNVLLISIYRMEHVSQTIQHLNLNLIQKFIQEFIVTNYIIIIIFILF